MKVYTKTGDGGTTSLIGGERVSKADPRVEAYGTVDELSAHLALLADMMRCATGFGPITAALDEIQKELMTVEALLASGPGNRNANSGSGRAESKVPPLPAAAIKQLEAQIDTMGAGLPVLKGFTIPGGHPVVSQCHVCRTVCRRAERAVVRVSEHHPVAPGVGEYLNRLSDWLYTVGRKSVDVLGLQESYWTP